MSHRAGPPSPSPLLQPLLLPPPRGRARRRRRRLLVRHSPRTDLRGGLAGGITELGRRCPHGRSDGAQAVLEARGAHFTLG